MLLMSKNCGTVNTGYWVNLSVAAMEFPFYMLTTGHVVAPYPFFTTRSERDDVQLIFTRAGAASITWRNESALLYPGNVVMIYCKELHDYRTTSRDPWVYDYIHFSGSALKNYAPYLLDALHVITPTDMKVFEKSFELIFSGQLRNDPLSISRTFTMITGMLNALMEARELPTALNSQKSSVGLLPALNYIREHYQEDISVEKLSEQCHLSKYYFIRAFHTATGESPYQYIIKFRINQAKTLLTNSKLPVEEIAERVGFSNYSNFANQFKRLNDVTPSAYRNAVVMLNGRRDGKGKTQQLPHVQ